MIPSLQRPHAAYDAAIPMECARRTSSYELRSVKRAASSFVLFLQVLFLVHVMPVDGHITALSNHGNRRGGGGGGGTVRGRVDDADTAEWSSVLRGAAAAISVASSEPSWRCVDIPRNFSLCHGMQYTSMRLPNLLDHDSLDEAIQQSDAWNSLIQLHCHPDTKLFLCSLFAPVCLPTLDKHIAPCQSLCTAVKQGCEGRMAQYGFPWPEMLRCQFPLDNDMCIKPMSSEAASFSAATESAAATTKTMTTTTTSSGGSSPDDLRRGGGVKAAAAEPPISICTSCSQVATFENLMDNYCRSYSVMKVRLKSRNATHAVLQRQRSFKDATPTTTMTRVRRRAGIRRGGGELLTVRLDASTGGDGTQQPSCDCSALPSPSQLTTTIASSSFLVMANNVCWSSSSSASSTAVFTTQQPQQAGGGGELVARLVMPWKQNDKAFKRAIRKFRKVNCSTLGREIRESVLRKSTFKRTIY